MFGIAFAVFGDNPLFAPYNKALASIFWHTADTPQQVQAYRKFIYAPLGGTIACCYILLAFIARHPFRNKEPWARNAIIAAFGTWIILDSAVCFFYHVYFQVYIINAFSFLQKALPLIFTWNDFKPGVGDRR
ncbi:MAG: hypothetical protein ABIY51_16050 [Ferruginibacter sp.]